MPTPTFPLRSAFTALPLDAAATDVVVALQRQLGPFSNCLSFQPAATAHLTLAYWLELMAIEWPPLLEGLRTVAARTPLFDLPLQGYGMFGERGAERVLYLHPVFSSELAALKKRCPWPQAHPFVPHVTIARVTHAGRFAVVRKAVEKVLAHVACCVRCDRLCLYATVDGISQTPLAEALFAG